MGWHPIRGRCLAALILAVLVAAAALPFAWLANIETCVAPGMEGWPPLQATLLAVASVAVPVTAIYMHSRRLVGSRPMWQGGSAVAVALLLVFAALALSEANLGTCDGRARPTNWHERETYRNVAYSVASVSSLLLAGSLGAAWLQGHRKNGAVEI